MASVIEILLTGLDVRTFGDILVKVLSHMATSG